MNDYVFEGEYRPASALHATNLRHAFVIPGEPQVKSRPRFTKTGVAYTPKETRTAEANVLEAFIESGGDLITGRVGVLATFFCGTRRRKDADNLLKLILDALNTHAFTDDYLVHELGCSKYYTTTERARTEVSLYSIPDEMIAL
jgi:Holliday junction resolvase RusA-like endonuclease